MGDKWRGQFQRICLITVLMLLALRPAIAQQDEDAIAAFIDNWLAAWQDQDTDTYFSAYHPDFSPTNFSDIDAWRQNRVRNISRPDRILITRENITVVSQDENAVIVRFDFTYRAPDYADTTTKELVLAVADDTINGIVGETSLAVVPLPDAWLNGDDTDAATGTGAIAPVVSEQGRDDPVAPAPELPNTVLTEAREGNPAEVALVEVRTPETVFEVEAPVEPTPVEQIQSEQVQIEQAQVTRATPRHVSSNADWVPPGFENLNQPQVTEIDVYYGGYFLTSVLAEFTEQEVTILDTAGLTGQISGLKNPEGFQALLNTTLDAHTELLCFSEFQTGCGTLETDAVEIIFDRSQLRMWLFIAPDLLQDAGSDIIRFLPPSAAGLSFMNQTAAYFTTRELSLNTYNLFNNTLFSWGENRFSMRSNLVSDEGFDVDTLAFMREFRGKDYRLGLVREDANGFSFMNNERFTGASFASSLLTRTDLERSLGTEIELYFSTRSRVEIYREGRLISSDIYSVGNQLLNTADLPNGSYTIEIRITDAAGNITVEERYYSKTANIPPADQSLYFFHVGQLENELDVNRLSRTGENELLVRGGYNMRIGPTLGGSLGFSVVEDTSFLELGLFKQGQNFEFQANAAYENTGASGMDFRLRYRHPGFNVLFNGRQVFNGLEESQIGQDYQQYNAMVEVPMRSGFLSVFHRHIERPLVGRNLNSGIRYRTLNTQIPGGTLGSSFELSKNDKEILALWSFSWTIRNDNRSSTYAPTLAYANEHSSRDSGLYGSYETNWYRGQQSGNEYTYSLRGDYDSQSSLEARMAANTRLGSADITGRYNEVTEVVEMNGRLSTSFATLGRVSAIGGKRRSESAFLVRVEGEVDENARFNVLVNGSVRGQLAADQTLLIPVSPYSTYNVELKAVGDTLVALDNRVYRETMYPGNVVNLTWSSQIINIAIGRLVDEAGVPMANAVIQNVVGIAIADDNGVFQAEVNHATSELRVVRGSDTCIARFENPRTTDTVLQLGTLVCR